LTEWRRLLAAEKVTSGIRWLIVFPRRPRLKDSQSHHEIILSETVLPVRYKAFGNFIGEWSECELKAEVGKNCGALSRHFTQSPSRRDEQGNVLSKTRLCTEVKK
jgi:hypothetical protein